MKNCLKLPCFAGRVLHYFIKTAALEVVVSIHWWDGGCGGRCHAHLQLQHQSNWGYDLAQKNVHWRNFRFLEGKAPGSCLSWTKVSQIPLLRRFSSQCCNVLLEMSGHATATFPCKKNKQNWSLCFWVYKHLGFQQVYMKLRPKSVSQPNQLLTLVGAIFIIVTTSKQDCIWGLKSSSHLWHLYDTVVPCDAILALNKKHWKSHFMLKLCIKKLLRLKSQMPKKKKISVLIQCLPRRKFPRMNCYF